MDKFSGYKTYIFAVLMGLLAMAHYLGYIDDTLYNSGIGLLGAGTAAALGAKVNRVDKKLLIVLPLVLLFGVSTYAQTSTVRENAPVTFAADHDGMLVTHYTIMEGTVQKAMVPVSASVGGVVTIVVPGGFPKGTHTVVMQACGDGGCADSNPLVFTVIPNAPTAPTNLRIISK